MQNCLASIISHFYSIQFNVFTLNAWFFPLPLCVARSFSSRWMWCQIRRTKTLVMAWDHKILMISVKCCDKDILKNWARAQDCISAALIKFSFLNAAFLFIYLSAGWNWKSDSPRHGTAEHVRFRSVKTPVKFKFGYCVVIKIHCDLFLIC